MIIVKNLYNDIKSRCQRFIKGYADRDIYNIKFWFMDNLEPMLIRLRNEHKGCPLRYTDKKYEEIIEEMANCLHLMNEDNVYELFDTKRRIHFTPDVVDVMEKNKKRFFELFSEMFWDLWD